MIEQVVIPIHAPAVLQSLETLSIFVASYDWDASLDDLHPLDFLAFANHLVGNQVELPCLKDVSVVFVKPQRSDPTHRCFGDDTAWKTEHPPTKWSDAIQNALEPLEAVGIGIEVKWVSCNRQIWFSPVRDAIVCVASS